MRESLKDEGDRRTSVPCFTWAAARERRCCCSSRGISCRTCSSGGGEEGASEQSPRQHLAAFFPNQISRRRPSLSLSSLFFSLSPCVSLPLIPVSRCLTCANGSGDRLPRYTHSQSLKPRHETVLCPDESEDRSKRCR